MERTEILNIVELILGKEKPFRSSDVTFDWESSEEYFKCEFSSEFKDFIEIMFEYSYPDGILSVSDSVNSENSTIQIAYDIERDIGDWPSYLVPYCDIGNGDYYCLSSLEATKSKVYYYDHESQQYEKLFDSFDEFIRQLPDFFL